MNGAGPVLFYTDVPKGAKPGDVFTVRFKGSKVKVEVPTKLPDDNRIPVHAAKLPFSWENHGLKPPPLPLPKAKRALRRCHNCAAVMSRATPEALCTICLADTGFVSGREELPPPGVSRTRGVDAAGWKVCPRCGGSVSAAGYSWVHHMKLCDKAYFKLEIERFSLAMVSDMPELRCLQPDTRSSDDQSAPLPGHPAKRAHSPNGQGSSPVGRKKPAPRVPYFDRRAPLHDRRTVDVAAHRLFACEGGDALGTQARSGWELPAGKQHCQKILDRYYSNTRWFKDLCSQPMGSVAAATDTSVGSVDEEAIAFELAEAEHNDSLKNLDTWAQAFVAQQRSELAEMPAQHNSRLSKSRERQAVCPRPPGSRGTAFDKPLEKLPGVDQKAAEAAAPAGAGLGGGSTLINPAELSIDRSSSRLAPAAPSELNIDEVICQVCNSGEDDEHMLLCGDGEGAGCDLGFHMYCVKPKLKKIPEDDWFCSTCTAKRTKVKRGRPKKASATPPAGATSPKTKQKGGANGEQISAAEPGRNGDRVAAKVAEKGPAVVSPPVDSSGGGTKRPRDCNNGDSSAANGVGTTKKQRMPGELGQTSEASTGDERQQSRLHGNGAAAASTPATEEGNDDVSGGPAEQAKTPAPAPAVPPPQMGPPPPPSEPPPGYAEPDAMDVDTITSGAATSLFGSDSSSGDKACAEGTPAHARRSASTFISVAALHKQATAAQHSYVSVVALRTAATATFGHAAAPALVPGAGHEMRAYSALQRVYGMAPSHRRSSCSRAASAASAAAMSHLAAPGDSTTLPPAEHQVLPGLAASAGGPAFGGSVELKWRPLDMATVTSGSARVLHAACRPLAPVSDATRDRYADARNTRTVAAMSNLLAPGAVDDEGHYDPELASANSGDRLSVVCPAGTADGESLRVCVPGNAWRVVKVSVPAGVTPGSRFNVDLPPNLPPDHGVGDGDDGPVGPNQQRRVCLEGNGMWEGGWKRKRGLVVAVLP